MWTQPSNAGPPGGPEPRRQQDAPPHLLSPTPAAKQQNCLLTFGSIYKHLQTGEGTEKVPIYGFVCGFFFSLFPQDILARKPGDPRGIYQHSTPPIKCKILP